MWLISPRQRFSILLICLRFRRYIRSCYRGGTSSTKCRRLRHFHSILSKIIKKIFKIKLKFRVQQKENQLHWSHCSAWFSLLTNDLSHKSINVCRNNANELCEVKGATTCVQIYITLRNSKHVTRHTHNVYLKAYCVKQTCKYINMYLI